MYFFFVQRSWSDNLDAYFELELGIELDAPERKVTRTNEEKKYSIFLHGITSNETKFGNSLANIVFFEVNNGFEKENVSFKLSKISQ